SNPDATNASITQSDVTNGAFLDVTWKVRNKGNTAGSFNVKTFLTKNAPAGFKKQLILHKQYTTPITTSNSCTETSQSQTLVVANIANPDATNSGGTNPDATNPDATNLA